MTDTIKANEFIEFSLRSLCEDICTFFDAETIFIKSSIYFRLDDAIRAETEEIVKNRGKKVRKKLVVLIETNGGFVEIVERISDVFRRHFSEVVFVVPNFAYSAGTVLAMSGDSIYMDYYSVLGPIDPQVQGPDGKFIPGMGYLYKYQELINKSKMRRITDAELLFLTKRFDPAEMFVIEQQKSHSEELIKKWLCQYKFKNWKKTTTRGRRVTQAMKEGRAAEIASILADASRWHSHGRGINMRELTGEKIKLQIEDFGKDDNLSKKISQYYDLFTDYLGKIGVSAAIHTCYNLRRLG